MSKKDVASIVSGAGWIASFAGLLVEELERLGMSAENIHKLAKPTQEGRALVRVCASKIAEAAHGGQSEFLNLIPGGQNLVIGPTVGSRILAEAKDVFHHIDPGFKKLSVDGSRGPTEETLVKIYEEKKDATFIKIFNSLSFDLHSICFTQGQIIDFADKHREWLRDQGWGNYFLFKSHEFFYVACVNACNIDKLEVFLHKFKDSYVEKAYFHPRIFVPQLP